MPKGYPNPKPEKPETVESATEEFSIEPPATRAAIEVNNPMVTIKLEKNYRPMEFDGKTNFEVVGHTKAAVIVKDAAGRPVVVDKAEFIHDEPMPAKQAGTGFIDKLLAGTVVKFSKVEARHIRANGIGSLEIDLD